MFNRVDKCFFISLIIMFFAIISPFVLIFCESFHLGKLLEILLDFMVVFCVFALPIVLIIQIITFIMKIFSKNKHKKDWIILGFNCISIITLFLIFHLLFWAISNPLL